MDRAEQMASEIHGLLQGLLRDPWGRLKGERLRQLERLGMSMKLSESDFAFVKAEIVEIRKAQLARLEKWHRLSGGR